MCQITILSPFSLKDSNKIQMLWFLPNDKFFYFKAKITWIKRKTKTSVKILNMHFYPLFEPTSDSLTIRIIHINSLHINLYYLTRDQSLQFSQKILRIGGVKNIFFFFWVEHFDFFFKHFFFALSLLKSVTYQGLDNILMITQISSKKLWVCNNRVP